MAAVEDVKVDIYTMNRFLDLNEFDTSPVKTVLKGRPMRIIPNIRQKHIFDVKKHEVTSHDSWFGLVEGNKYNYVTIDYDYNLISTAPLDKPVGSSMDYLTFIFLENSEEVFTWRTRVTLWDVLSDLGGILEIIVLGAPALLLVYRGFKFKASVASELYLTENTN